MSEMPASVQGRACCPNLARWAEALAGVFALVAAGGSLYLTLGERLIACPLCLYQRMAAMSVAVSLIAGWLFVQPPGRGLSVLAFPLGVCGLTVAAFHVWKEWSQAMVCPMGLWDLGTAPQQSLVLFLTITVFLGVSIIGAADRTLWWNRGSVALVLLAVLGVGMAYLLIVSGPPPSGRGEYQTLLQKRRQHELKICTPVGQVPTVPEPPRQLPMD